jgi:pimeloyl-ACP methyl ester carboxylesterase
MLSNVADREAGFLLLDYPGSGFCQGSCTPARILAASEAAAEALRIRLGITPEAFADRLGVFGYSLGTATALQYAAKHQVRRIVVAAPFTTLAEIGDLFYFWPCGQLIRDRFDNIARLAEIADQQHRPPLLIMHGDQDDTIPMTMSARLAAPYPTWVERIVVRGADHDTVVPYALRALSVR